MSLFSFHQNLLKIHVSFFELLNHNFYLLLHFLWITYNSYYCIISNIMKLLPWYKLVRHWIFFECLQYSLLYQLRMNLTSKIYIIVIDKYLKKKWTQYSSLRHTQVDIVFIWHYFLVSISICQLVSRYSYDFYEFSISVLNIQLLNSIFETQIPINVKQIL